MASRDNCKSCGATSADKCVCGVHTCSYECERPACVRRQRDELRDVMYAREDKKEVMQIDAGHLPEPRPVAPPGLSSDGPGVSKVALPEPYHHDCTGNGMRCMDGHGCECEMKGSGPQETPYTAAQLESYAAARVAEATDELQRRVAELEANDRRYRWLRDGNDDKTSSYARDLANKHYGSEWDRIIDADILADREGGKP